MPSFHSGYRDRLLAQFAYPLTPTKKPLFAVSLLTHLGSNQDSAEPKSDVLPITPWVSVPVSGAAKLEKF